MKIRWNNEGPCLLPRENRGRERGVNHLQLRKGDEAEVKAGNPSYDIWLLAGLALPADEKAEKRLADLQKAG